MKHLQRSVRRKGLTGSDLLRFPRYRGFQRLDFVKLTGHALASRFGESGAKRHSAPTGAARETWDRQERQPPRSLRCTKASPRVRVRCPSPGVPSPWIAALLWSRREYDWGRRSGLMNIEIRDAGLQARNQKLMQATGSGRPGEVLLRLL